MKSAAFSLLFVLVTSSASAQSVGVDSYAGVYGVRVPLSGSSIVTYDDEHRMKSPTGPLTQEAALGGPTAWKGSAGATSDFGLLKTAVTLKGSLTLDSDSQIETANSAAQAGFTDIFNFSGDRPFGKFSMTFDFHGVFRGNPAQMFTNLYVFVGNDQAQEYVFPQEELANSEFQRTFTTKDFSLEYGYPVKITAYLYSSITGRVDVWGPPTTSFDASIDLSHTVALKQFNVLNADGSADTSARVVADSGHQYRVNAVPEPASMAALGLGVLALLNRRKKV